MAKQHPIRYRDYTIERIIPTPPIPRYLSNGREIRPKWEFVHDEYDGAPDAWAYIGGRGHDPRCGHAITLELAIEEIDEITLSIEDDNE